MQEKTKLLIVEDDDIDYQAVLRVFERRGITHPVARAVDGVEAIEKLKGLNGNAPMTGSVVILMDINLPRLSGLDCVLQIRSDEALKDHKIIMVSTSNAQRDVITAYSLDVDGYIVKRDLENGLVKALTKLGINGAVKAA